MHASDVVSVPLVVFVTLMSVIFMGLTFVVVVTPSGAPSVAYESVHTIVLPFQPGDIDITNPPKLPTPNEYHCFFVAS
jgi:hypothetical protein